MIPTSLKLASVLSTLKSTNAFHDGVPSTEIPFNVLIGGKEALNLFFNFNQTIVDQLLTHGCWCAKLNLGFKNSVQLGGPPADELDKICKLWISDRRCCRIDGGPCQNEFDTSSYEVHYDEEGLVNTTSCYDNDGDCYIDGCLIDAYYIDQLKLIIESNTEWQAEPAEIDQCGGGGKGSPPAFSYCVGEFNHETGVPEYQIVHDPDEIPDIEEFTSSTVAVTTVFPTARLKHSKLQKSKTNLCFFNLLLNRLYNNGSTRLLP